MFRKRMMTDAEMYEFIAKACAHGEKTGSLGDEWDVGAFESGVKSALIALGYDYDWVTGLFRDTLEVYMGV